MKYLIRQEEVKDYRQTEALIKEAFLTAEMTDGNEHTLVEKLRKGESFIPELSLVAEDGGEIVGHIMLTKNKIVDDNLSYDSLTLAPLSVLPPFKNQGIGSHLINKALDEAKKRGFKSVIVLGHPEYYSKFGFKAASNWEITCPFPVPSEAFMAIELVKNGLAEINGKVKYPAEFLES